MTTVELTAQPSVEGLEGHDLALWSRRAVPDEVWAPAAWPELEHASAKYLSPPHTTGEATTPKKPSLLRDPSIECITLHDVPRSPRPPPRSPRPPADQHTAPRPKPRYVRRPSLGFHLPKLSLCPSPDPLERGVAQGAAAVSHRGLPEIQEVRNGLFIGTQAAACQKQLLNGVGITHILSMLGNTPSWYGDWCGVLCGGVGWDGMGWEVMGWVGLGWHVLFGLLFCLFRFDFGFDLVWFGFSFAFFFVFCFCFSL